MEKIQELTDKIYREGVEKGEAEAKQLVEAAKVEAERILAEAKAKAEAVVTEAEKKAEELDAHTKSELRLYAGQALNALKTETVNVISDKLAGLAVRDLASMKDFPGKFVIAMAQNWQGDGAVAVSAADAEALKAYFAANAKALLEKGLKIEKVNGKTAGFTISPADGSYKVSFGDEEFSNYFKEFLRPQLIEMLF